MRATALVAQPAGDADVPVLVQVIEKLVTLTGEAMHHRRADATLEVLHLCHEIGMRVALVQEQRLAVVCGQLQLALERTVLGRARREVTEVVQPALAHRHHFRAGMQRAHLGVAFLGVFHCMVRVHAGGGIQEARVLLRQLQGQWRVLAAGTGDDHLHHAGLARALQHGIAVAVEGVVSQVGADIDQVHGGATGQYSCIL